LRLVEPLSGAGCTAPNILNAIVKAESKMSCELVTRVAHKNNPANAPVLNDSFMEIRHACSYHVRPDVFDLYRAGQWKFCKFRSDSFNLFLGVVVPLFSWLWQLIIYEEPATFWAAE
jgi:hypothetical protein